MSISNLGDPVTAILLPPHTAAVYTYSPGPGAVSKLLAPSYLNEPSPLRTALNQQTRVEWGLRPTGADTRQTTSRNSMANVIHLWQADK
jgi:hypothetical protein